MKRQYKKSLIPALKNTPNVVCEICGSTRFNKDGITIHKGWNNKECFEDKEDFMKDAFDYTFSPRGKFEKIQNNMIKEMNMFAINQFENKVENKVENSETIKKLLERYRNNNVI